MPTAPDSSSAPEVVAAALVYDELRAVARRYVRREPLDLTLDATALVHEVYLSFAGRPMPDVHDDAHFVALSARLMRQILVTHARRRRVRPAVHAAHRTALDAAVTLVEAEGVDLSALDVALGRLRARDPRKASVVELRYFAGLDDASIAPLLGVSTRTVRREWVLARGWLRRELDR